MSKQEFKHATDAIDSIASAVGCVVTNLAFDVEFEGRLDCQRAKTVASLLALKDLADRIIDGMYADDLEDGRAEFEEAMRKVRADVEREHLIRTMLGL